MDGLSFASHSKNYDPLNAGQHGTDARILPECSREG